MRRGKRLRSQSRPYLSSQSQIAANKLKTTVIGVPGVGNFREVIPLIREWETKKFILAYDMDTRATCFSISRI